MARNGYLAEDGIVLVTVEDDDQLIPTAAAAFFAARAAAAADGVTMSIVEPAGAYRRAWVQNDMVDHPERWNLNPNSSIGFSRYGQSHGWGNRIDINSAAVPWMLRRGHEFGWTREYGARDPNHFKHDGVTAVAGAGTLRDADRVRTTIEEEDDMGIKVIAHYEGGETKEVALVSPELENGYAIAKGGTPEALGWLRTYSPTQNGLPQARLAADDYLGAIASAKAARAAWLAGQPAAAAAAGEGDASGIIKAIEKLGAQIEALPALLIAEQKKPGN